jgi:phospholipid/cholesterol/gamma-HCH transport system substrate-binding protein
VRRAIAKHLRDFAALAVLAAIGIGAAAYILNKQDFRIPLIEESPFEIKAEFSEASGVKPGQNQAVRIAGVRIGEISDVEVDNGRAVLTLAIDRKYAQRIHRDATALLRPRTGLEDMFVELEPGTPHSPRMPEHGRIGIGDTLPEVRSDQILSELDARTRDYLKLLIDGGGRGLAGRADDLRALLRRLEPLHRDLARVEGALADQRHALRRLVHNYGALTTELARQDGELTTLVRASSQVFSAFAEHDTDLERSVARLPGALRETRAALAKVEPFANELGPSLESLRPAFRHLDEANEALRRLAVDTTPAVRSEIRPFVRRATPYLADLEPGARNLAQAMPDLDTSFAELNRFFNMAAYNPNGAEPVSGEAARDARREEGYLFWLAWLSHTSNNLFSTSDVSGPFRRSNFAISCSTLRGLVSANPALEQILGVTALLGDTSLCPVGGGEPLVPLPKVRDNAAPGGLR